MIQVKSTPNGVRVTNTELPNIVGTFVRVGHNIVVKLPNQPYMDDIRTYRLRIGGPDVIDEFIDLLGETVGNNHPGNKGSTVSGSINDGVYHTVINIPRDESTKPSEGFLTAEATSSGYGFAEPEDKVTALHVAHQDMLLTIIGHPCGVEGLIIPNGLMYQLLETLTRQRRAFTAATQPA